MKLLYKPDPTKNGPQNCRALARKLVNLFENDDLLREEVAMQLNIDEKLLHIRQSQSAVTGELDDYQEI